MGAVSRQRDACCSSCSVRAVIPLLSSLCSLVNRVWGRGVDIWDRLQILGSAEKVPEVRRPWGVWLRAGLLLESSCVVPYIVLIVLYSLYKKLLILKIIIILIQPSSSEGNFQMKSALHENLQWNIYLLVTSPIYFLLIFHLFIQEQCFWIPVKKKCLYIFIYIFKINSYFSKNIKVMQKIVLPSSVFWKSNQCMLQLLRW